MNPEDAIAEHLRRNPNAHRTALIDPVFAAEVHRLRLVLTGLDAVLEDEGLAEEMRRRIAARLVADLVGTDEENAARVRRHEELLRMEVPGFVTKAEVTSPSG
ncbi:hypothetical protein ACFWAP_09035 [Streptomyces goshikiensis]|uniref:hypothetical protein n=1 Tax=Streptomyces goshikiensis TaxID=1942 RepID=UPI0036488582